MNENFKKENKTVKFLNKFILWYFLFGNQIILVFVTILGIWFENFLGILSLLISISYIYIFFFLKRFKIKITNKIFIIFILHLSLFSIALLFSDIFGEEYFIYKTELQLIYIFLPSLVGIILAHENSKSSLFNEKFLLFCFLSFIITFFFYSYYSKISTLGYRFGEEVNPLGFSFVTIVTMFLFIVYFKNIFVKLVILLLCIFISIATGTLRGVVGTAFAGLSYIIFSKLRHRKKEKIKVYKKINKRNNLYLYITLSVVIIIFCYYFLNNYYIFGYKRLLAKRNQYGMFMIDEGRIMDNNKAIQSFFKNPFIGNFAYEKIPGTEAHNFILDILGQYGILGSILYFYIVISAFIYIFKNIGYVEDNDYFYIIFLYDLSIALTVGSGNYPEFWLLNYFIIENMEINKKRERNWIIKND